MKVYGEELRMKVVEAEQKGYKWREIKEMLGVSMMTICRYKKAYKETGKVERKKRVYPRRVSNKTILEYVETHRDALQRDIAKALGISRVTVYRRFLELGIKLKKKLKIYRESCKKACKRFIEKLNKYKSKQKVIVYVDESCFDLNMTREHVWARKGEKILGEVSGKRTDRRETLVAGLCENKIIAPITFKGTTDSVTLNCWLTDHLLPCISGKKAVIVMDNAAFHKSVETKHIIKKNRHILLFLPPYSPHLNPIERMFGSIKKHFKNTEHSIPDDILRMQSVILRFI
jgi:transposase